MRRAIKALQERIERINVRIVETEKITEEPEMVCDYEFAMNDLANYELEIIELQQAILILNKQE